ncbi:uncharacterized protein LOC132713191, partial [Ruditapes philippinarum]|uniref:uncharacterized protein LOC132713191 n=1 Tax=Ruditapes philippinarum TaxID=129788 RepID=UPI00295C1162
MRLLFSAALILLLQVVSIYCIGHLYVGILGYNNNNINTTCCSDKSCENTVGCALIFEIVVDGLNGSEGPVSGRPSNTPLTPGQAASFIGESVTNPLSFAFNRWPGGAEVTVNVLDGDTLVDQFNDS